AVNADFVRSKFLGDAFHHQHDSSLAGGIIGVPRPGNYFVYAAHTNDFTCSPGFLWYNASSQKFTDRSSCTKKLAGKVYTEHRIPLLQCHFFKGRIALQASVVYEYVNGAKPGYRFVEHFFNFFL